MHSLLLGKKPVAPHITLITHPGSEAYQVGEAAAEFEQLFLNRIAPKPAGKLIPHCCSAC